MNTRPQRSELSRTGVSDGARARRSARRRDARGAGHRYQPGGRSHGRRLSRTVRLAVRDPNESAGPRDAGGRGANGSPPIRGRNGFDVRGRPEPMHASGTRTALTKRGNHNCRGSSRSRRRIHRRGRCRGRSPRPRGGVTCAPDATPIATRGHGSADSRGKTRGLRGPCTRWERVGESRRELRRPMPKSTATRAESGEGKTQGGPGFDSRRLHYHPGRSGMDVESWSDEASGMAGRPGAG